MQKSNSILLILAVFFITVSCASKSTEQTNEKTSHKIDTTNYKTTNTPKTSLEDIENPKKIINDSLFKIQFPEIDSVAEYAIFRDSLVEYYNKVFNSEITEQSQIENIFELRDKLLKRMTDLSYNYSESIDDNYKKWDIYHAELVKFGFRPIYAEGMFTGLSISPILEKEIKKVCSQEYQLFIKFRLAEANSFGGEYPYLDLSAQIEMVLTGEKMQKDFPQSEYNKMIEKSYRFAVGTLTDLHAVLKDGKITEYLLQDISRDFWPNATDISYMENFVKKHYKSKFAKVIKKILKNTSELEIGEDENKGDVYLVAVESFDNEKQAEDRVFEFLNKGIDIPHAISSKKNKTEQFNVVYRFYSDKKKAEKALSKIQKKFKDAKLIHIDFQWNEIEL